MYPGAHAATTPDKAATIMAGTGEVVTYRQLDEAANRFSRLLRDRGIQQGDHIAFCVENHPCFYELAWGAVYAGAYYTAISTRLTAEEVAYILEDCGASVFVTSAAKADVAAEIHGSTAVTSRLMIDGTTDGYESYEDAVASFSDEPLDEERVQGKDMLYSSGTTGQPKGVKPSAPDAPLDSPTSVTVLGQMIGEYSPDMVYLSPAPLYHAAPLRFTLSTHQVGGTVVVMERFDPAEMLRLIEEHGVTHTQVVPTMFIRMLKLPDAVRNAHDVSRLKFCVHAAAPCPIPVKEQMIDWWGPVIHEYYAGTEGNGFVYCNSHDWLAHKGTVGQALTGIVHIVDDAGNEVPVGDEGTIYFESNAVFEYHNDPDKTASSRLANGWTTLGDVGRLDDDGFLYLTDRKAHMIITGGVNVYPQEAENVLAVHPSVADVAVIGVPDEDFGEQVKAVVELVDGAAASPELASELIATCREHLADVKCPRSVDFVDELPRHPTGKLYKRLLKDRYWEGHTSRII